jgi:uncharacterized membrane protein YfcA
LAAPVAVGALAGSFIGARILPRANVRSLRLAFAVLVALAGVQMLIRGVQGVMS